MGNIDGYRYLVIYLSKCKDLKATYNSILNKFIQKII